MIKGNIIKKGILVKFQANITEHFRWADLVPYLLLSFLFLQKQESSIKIGENVFLSYFLAWLKYGV